MSSSYRKPALLASGPMGWTGLYGMFTKDQMPHSQALPNPSSADADKHAAELAAAETARKMKLRRGWASTILSGAGGDETGQTLG